MVDEKFEFLISQYLDGTLSEAERARVEARLVADVEAQAVLAEYRKLNNRLVVNVAAPAVRWDRLAAEISAAVEKQSEPLVIPYPAFTFGWKLRVAAAACVAMAGAVAVIHSLHHKAPVVEQTVASSVIAQGPQAERPAGPAMQQISVGPSPALAAKGESWRYAEGVVARPSHIELAGEMKASPAGQSHIH
jgi:anti-sigma factor RsiW